MKRRARCLLFVVGLALASAAPRRGGAADWPTYSHSNQRNAVTDEKLALPLSEAWVHQDRHAPQPAWPPPAKNDLFHGKRDLDPRVTFDQAYQVAAVGDSLYYGSSADHQVRCLDAATGRVRWSFFTEGPVRLAPTVWKDMVYFGSDDGWVYCLKAGSGKLLWKYRPGPEDRRLAGNGQVISLWPVCSGVLVEGEVAYACAGLFPAQGAYLCALDAATGKEHWKKDARCVSQGYLAVAGTGLLIPAGRIGLASFDLRTGKREKTGFDKALVGTYLVATPERLYFQQNRYHRQLGVAGSLCSLPTEFVVEGGGAVYFHGKEAILALKLGTFSAWLQELAALQDRLDALRRKQKEKDGPKDGEEPPAQADPKALAQAVKKLEAEWEARALWRCPMRGAEGSGADARPFSLILAGEVLFAGRDGRVLAIGAKDGRELWSGRVAGRACGLAAARGRLFVSTDRGAIHCFVPSTSPGPRPPASQAPPPPSPRPRDATASGEPWPLDGLPAGKGYCLILGGGDGQLVREVLRRTELRVIVLEPDGKRAGDLRAALDEAGLYGPRAAVHHGPLQRLPYPRYFANVVVIGRGADTPPAEVGRVLRPCGGTALLVDGGPLKQWMKGDVPVGGEFVGDRLLRRGALPGAGEWTHQYADPSNRACSGDALVGGPLEVLWFGGPGPRPMIDRHSTTMASLFKDGRLFVPADERVIAVDAYNGTPLWEIEVPGARRVGVMRDSGHMAAGADHLYVVTKGECWALEAGTGKHALTLNAPRWTSEAEPEWGYLAVVGDRLFGTAQEPGASYLSDRARDMCSVLRGAFRPHVVGRCLFSLDRRSGQTKWLRQKGAVLNCAIAIEGGRVYFLESRDPKALAGIRGGRARLDEIFAAPSHLVALEAETGKPLWETEVRLPFEHLVFLCAAGDTVLIGGSFSREDGLYYGLRAHRADTGQPRWARDFRRGGKPGIHGEEWQHPVIAGNRVLAKCYQCDLQTGEPLEDFAAKGIGGDGCCTLSGSASVLFARGGRYELAGRRWESLNQRISRSGCFVNIIPAGGIVSVPESSSGCTCAYPMQTSFAFVPATEGSRTGGDGATR